MSNDMDELAIAELRVGFIGEDEDDPRTWRHLHVCNACGDVHKCESESNLNCDQGKFFENADD
jgi:hypothetical protein